MDDNMRAKKDSITSNKYYYSIRNLWSGFLFGLGLVVVFDGVVFHQLLRWHHFYDRSTTDIGLISDGLLHAFGWFATIAGLFLFADLHRRHGVWFTRWWGGVFFGAGLFQLYDGIIQHKLMQVHQIRYVDNLIVYDVVWNVVAIALILAGMLLINRTKGKKQKEGVVPSGHT